MERFESRQEGVYLKNKLMRFDPEKMKLITS